MDQRLFRELADNAGQWQATPAVVRLALLSMHDALARQQEDMRTLRAELSGHVSIADHETGLVELRSLLRKKTDLDYVNQQLDNKANIIDMYNALKAKANAAEVLQKLAEKAPLAALAAKASKSSVASALRKKSQEVEEKTNMELCKVQLQVATLQGKVDAMHSSPRGRTEAKDSSNDANEVLADKAELEALRAALHDTVRHLNTEKHSSDLQLTRLAATVQELQQHVLSTAKALSQCNAEHSDLRRELQAVRDVVQRAEGGVRRDQVAIVVQQELGCHFSALAELDNRLHLLQNRIEDIHENAEQDRWGNELQDLKEALKGKVDAKELGGLKAAHQKELKAVVSKMTVPLCQQLQETTAALDKVETDLQRFSQHLERKVSHNEMLALVETKCDRTELQALREETSGRATPLQVVDLTRRVNELANSHRMLTTECNDNHAVLVKQLAAKPDHQDLLKIAADITKELPRQPVGWQECIARSTDSSNRLDAMHQRLKVLSTTCEQVSEAVLALRQQSDTMVDRGDLEEVLRHQEALMVQGMEHRVMKEVHQVQDRVEQLEGTVAECHQQCDALSRPLQLHKEQVEDLKARIGAVGLAMDQFRRSILDEVAESRKSISARMKKLEASDLSAAGGAPPAEVIEALATLKGRLDEVQAMVVQQTQREDQEGLLHLRSLLDEKVSREELGKELASLDIQKVNRGDLEALLTRKVDLQVFCERLAAKANNSELHQWAEDLNKEIHRRLSVKTDLRQFELLAKEVDRKVDADKLNLILGKSFVATNAMVQTLAAPLVEEECSLQLSWSSRGSQDGLL
eukprot:GGOE01014365.1.p1 GENE.GGOE01014365.1~~GGOE01014365.1.p1  ORF type:complete len:809 (+),score=317.55 GGOE01014365.1:35-2461(+)